MNGNTKCVMIFGVPWLKFISFVCTCCNLSHRSCSISWRQLSSSTICCLCHPYGGGHLCRRNLKKKLIFKILFGNQFFVLIRNNISNNLLENIHNHNKYVIINRLFWREKTNLILIYAHSLSVCMYVRMYVCASVCGAKWLYTFLNGKIKFGRDNFDDQRWREEEKVFKELIHLL